MVAPPEVPRNASREQSEGPRERREKSAAQGVIQAGAFGLGPGCLGCYSSSMKVISTLTLYPVMLPFSIMTFWSLTHAPSTPLSVLVARATAWLMASSKPVSDVALNSVTRATLIVSASFQSSFCGLVAHLICGPTERKPNIMAEAPRRMPRPDRLWLRYCVERGPCLLCVGNVNVEVVDCRRGFPDEAGAGRVAHTHDL